MLRSRESEQIMAHLVTLEGERTEHGRATSESVPLPTERQWPSPIAKQGFHGITGEIVRAIEPHTEADPAALLFQFLVAFGNLVGRGPYTIADAARHGCNLFAAIVGVSSKGRKGTAWNHNRRVLEAVDPEWTDGRIQSGLSSGEGLIWSVRDPIEKQEAIRDGKVVSGYQSVQTDAGVSLDGAKVISTPHMLAALAAWDYCEASARFIFGDSLGYPEADRILAALRANPQGMTRTEIRDLFGRNQSEPVIQAALTYLEERGLAKRLSEQSGGRPVERWITMVQATTKTT